MAYQALKAALACIRRSRRLVTLSEEDLKDPKVKNDLRRSAIVMAIAGIDTYMHWLVYQRISNVRAGGDLPKSLAKLDLPFTEIAALADVTVRARQSGVISRPWVQVKRAMQKRLFAETFQSFDQVALAFSWAGIEKPWKKIATEMGEGTEDVKSQLNKLVHRRNQIAHEGDIYRAARPRKLKYNKIEHQQVVDSINWVERLLTATDKVVQ